MGIVDRMQTHTPSPRPRYRTRGSFQPIVGTYISTDDTCSSGVTTVDLGAIAYAGEVHEFWDMVTPNFFKRSAAGELITNPLRSLRESQTVSGNFAQGTNSANSCSSPIKHRSVNLLGPQAYWRITETPLGDHAFRLGKPPSLVSDSEMKSATEVATTAAWSKSTQHNADILVDIAEFGQLLRMLRDPIQTSSTLLRKINSKKRGAKGIGSHDVVDYANSLWLQYRFGIRPLVSSVQGVIKAIDRVVAKKRQTHRGSYYVKKDSLVSAHFIGNPFSLDYTMYHTDEVIIRTGLVIEDEVTFSQSLGVDASGILTLPWELVPFSFVADWFANVNSYLGALAPYLMKSPLSKWVTTVRRSSTLFNVTSTQVPPTWSLQRSAVETRSCTFEEKIRSPGLPGPSIAFKPQALSRISKDLRVVDAFALLQKQFAKVFMS
jgi:hypothetical protein